MQKRCKQCATNFQITNLDLEFLEKISPSFNDKKYQIPSPTLCPDCRQRRRLTFRNERNLYHRKCDLSGKQIISIYSSEKPLKVYAQEEWWSDKWDALDYGRSFDFSRSFFEQFNELLIAVPRVALWNTRPENAEYNHCCFGNKNCYMNFNTDYCEDSYYNYMSYRSKDIVDCIALSDSELCYECTDSERMYFCRFCRNCKACRNCDFCFDCINCEYCFGCVNLRNKKYCLFNEQLTKEEWQKRVRNLISDYSKTESVKQKFNAFLKKFPHRYGVINNSENCTGNYIMNCKNASYCFDVFEIEDSKYVTYMLKNSKNLVDAYAGLEFQNSYEIMSGEKIQNSQFILWVNNGPHFSSYCVQCVNNCKNLFGCVGLKHKEYCILNKQYSKEEYEELVPKIIEHMQKTGEWGEFFPIELSPFGYNETVAQEYFPLSKKEAIENGWKWKDEEKRAGYQGSEVKIPENIQEVSDDICKQILTCKVTGKNYKIIPQELEFYRKMQLPIPRKCPNQRYKERLSLRNPRKLWVRSCMKCQKEIQTSYAPDRPETVYCEECYLKEIY